MNINREDNTLTDLDNIIEQLCSNEGSIEIEKIAQDLDENEALSEAF